MSLKKINEQLDILFKESVMNELSPALKSKVADTRKAQWLAAQATADNAKSKYEKTRKLAGFSKKDYKDAADAVKKELSNLYDEYLFLQKDGGVYGITIDLTGKENWTENDELTETAIQQLEKLLKEMTNKYGIEYTYEVDGTKVTVICKKPEIKEQTKLQEILDGTYDDDVPVIYYIYDKLDELTVEQLTEIIERYDTWQVSPGLFPSSYKLGGFTYNIANYNDVAMDEVSKDFGTIAYPAKLAEALVRSNVVESLGDLYNVYYANSLLDDEAAEIFFEDALQNIGRELAWYEDIYKDTVEEMANTLEGDYPELADAIYYEINK